MSNIVGRLNINSCYQIKKTLVFGTGVCACVSKIFNEKNKGNSMTHFFYTISFSKAITGLSLT